MSEVATVTLAEFLLARIAEDEAAVNERTRYGAPRGSELLEQFGDFGDDERWMIEMPAGRLLAECEAKRQIVRLHEPYGTPQRMVYGTIIACSTCGSVDDAPHEWPCETLKALAAVYADHPDYREEWRL